MKKGFLIFVLFLLANTISSAQIVYELGLIPDGWALPYQLNDFIDKHWTNQKIEDQRGNYRNGKLKYENIQVGKKVKRKEYFADGKLFLEVDIIQKPGIDTTVIFDPETYHKTTRIESVLMDIMDGNFVEYNHNGTVRRKGKLKNATSIFKEGEDFSSEQLSFFPNGALQFKNIKEGKKTKREQYFEDGKLQLEAEIKQDVLVDTSSSYDPEKLTEIKTLFKHTFDELDGNYIEYNTNGTVKLKGEFRRGLKINHWIINNEEGNPVEDVTYNVKQEKEGKYTSFYSNGKIQKTGLYQVHISREKRKCMNPETYESIDCEVDVRKETERGKWIYYKENGEIQEEIDYK
jgi:antitoxin component YwqK of YwqJK toxin-antitoxin module